MPGGIDLCVSFFSKKSGNRLFVVTDDGKSLPHRGVIRLKLLKDNYKMTPHFFILSPIVSYCADDSADISPHLSSPVGEGLITIEYLNISDLSATRVSCIHLSMTVTE